jgi:3-dehydroquinate synthase
VDLQVETEKKQASHAIQPDIVEEIRVSFAHRIFFTSNLFQKQSPLFHSLLVREAPHAPAQVVVVIDRNVAEANPGLCASVDRYCREWSIALAGEPLLVQGGETAKNDREVVEQVHRVISDHGLSRHAYVVAIGGGAVLDAVGYAAATAHRGVRHIRVPTTTLSQADGGVGVKNGINAFGKKNFLGTFAPPWAVVCDSAFLSTLPERERRAGFVEAVKVALIRDASFFEWIENAADDLARFEMSAVEELVRRSARLHVEHISRGGDPFEHGSARPLDFGHWSAHKLEQMSAFRISHGEAVAIGAAIDTLVSVEAGHLGAEDADRVLRLLERLGFSLWAEELSREKELAGGLEEFREHLGGELTITLVRAPGAGFETHEMRAEWVRRALEILRERAHVP